MGMIRVSDHAEKVIKEMSNGRTITATVDALVAASVSPDGKIHSEPTLCAETRDYLDKKFDELKALIEDTTIDRVENKGGRKISGKTFLDWEITKEIFYEVMRDGGPEWFSEQTKFAIENLDTSLDCYIENDTLCSDDAYGSKRVILKVSPRIKEFLKSKGIDI